MKKTINRFDTIVYIASNPSDIEKVTEYSNLLFEALKLSDIAFKNYYILDDRTKHNVTNYIKQADLIFLSGGDTYIIYENLNHLDNIEQIDITGEGKFKLQTSLNYEIEKDIFQLCASKQWYIKEMTPIEKHLEDIFRQVTQN